MHQAARRRSQLPGRTPVSEAAAISCWVGWPGSSPAPWRTAARWSRPAAFRVHLWPNADPFYRNVAVPIEPTSDWQTAIAAMVRAFETAGRTPRLEFFAELWPDLPSALEAAGFVPERRGEVMAMEAFELRPAPSPVQPRTPRRQRAAIAAGGIPGPRRRGVRRVGSDPGARRARALRLWVAAGDHPGGGGARDDGAHQRRQPDRARRRCRAGRGVDPCGLAAARLCTRQLHTSCCSACSPPAAVAPGSRQGTRRAPTSTAASAFELVGCS